MDYDFEAPTYVNFAEAMDEDEAEISKYFGMAFVGRLPSSLLSTICFELFLCFALQMSSMNMKIRFA